MAQEPSQLSLARTAALRGEVDAAMPVLEAMAADGNAAASASLAELLAYAWQWEKVIPAAARLVANPFYVYAGNVFYDMVWLLSRAAQETKRWDEVAEVARTAARSIAARLDANDMCYPEVKIAADRRRLLTICDRLVVFVENEGDPPHHDEIDFFHLPKRTRDRQAYEEAAAKTAKKGLRHRLSLAVVYGVEDEAIRLVEDPGATPHFDDFVFVAGAHARQGRLEAAWAAIEAAWPMWWPVDVAQVAPVVLLTAHDLRPVVTATRAEALLHRPRASPR